MIGVPGTAQRLFGALREHGISVVLISQGSSEHSICFALAQAEADRAAAVVRDAFERELRQGQIQRVDVTRDCSILAVVGDGMAGTPGIAAKLFNALGSSGVNVRAIAQGASERNISVVIDEKQTARALGSVHASFYLSPHTLSIGLIGPGLGRQRLSRSARARRSDRLTRDFRLDLRVRGDPDVEEDAARRHRPCRWREWREALDDAAARRICSASSAHVDADHLPHAVIVDCTASAAIARHYPEWLAAGIHVVTPNKQAGSADLAFYRTLARGPARRRIALPLRGDGRRRAADHPDAARSARDRRSHPADRRHPLGHALVPVQRLGRRAAVLRARARREGAGLHRAGSARRPLGHGRRAQAGHPRARDGPRPRAGRRRSSKDSCRSRSSPATPAEFLERVPEVDAAMRERFEAARARGRVLRYVGRLDADTGARPSASSSSTGRISSRTSASPTTSSASRRAATTAIRWSCAAPAPARRSRPAACSPICCASAPTSARTL